MNVVPLVHWSTTIQCIQLNLIENNLNNLNSMTMVFATM